MRLLTVQLLVLVFGAHACAIPPSQRGTVLGTIESAEPSADGDRHSWNLSVDTASIELTREDGASVSTSDELADETLLTDAIDALDTFTGENERADFFSECSAGRSIVIVVALVASAYFGWLLIHRVRTVGASPALFLRRASLSRAAALAGERAEELFASIVTTRLRAPLRAELTAAAHTTYVEGRSSLDDVLSQVRFRSDRTDGHIRITVAVASEAEASLLFTRRELERWWAFERARHAITTLDEQLRGRDVVAGASSAAATVAILAALVPLMGCP